MSAQVRSDDVTAAKLIQGFGSGRFQPFDLESSYFVADGWELRLGLP